MTEFLKTAAIVYATVAIMWGIMLLLVADAVLKYDEKPLSKPVGTLLVAVLWPVTMPLGLYQAVRSAIRKRRSGEDDRQEC